MHNCSFWSVAGLAPLGARYRQSGTVVVQTFAPRQFRSGDIVHPVGPSRPLTKRSSYASTTKALLFSSAALSSRSSVGGAGGSRHTERNCHRCFGGYCSRGKGGGGRACYGLPPGNGSGRGRRL